MDSCLLCLKINEDLLDIIQTNSAQWQELNMSTILKKHFWLLNTIQPCSWICAACWEKVDDFHNFYLGIKEAHMTFEKIKFEEETELLPGQDKLNDAHEESEFVINYLEPEIVIDQNNIKVLADNEENKDNTVNINCIINKDPLKISKCNKFRKNYTEKELKIKTEQNDSNENIENNDKSVIVDQTENKFSEDLKVKTEPNDLFDNEDFFEDTVSDDDNEDADANYQPDKPCPENVKLGEGTYPYKDKDKFINEHFKTMSCDLCEIPIDNFTRLKKHFQTMHNKKGYVTCCANKFYQRNHLVDHIHCHKNPDYFKCTQCDKVLTSRRNFKNHKLSAHRPSDVVLKHCCDICGKYFTQSFNLSRHKLTHLPKEEKKFPCSECGKFYNSTNSLKLHTEVVHLKKHAKICYICGKRLNTSTEYKAHMNKHEGITAPPTNCDVCGLRLISERSLKLHKESQHPVGGKQDHPCPVCFKISPTARALKKHINTMHEKGYDHKCELCGRAFRRPETLKEHVASHTGNALYTCPWCPKTFNSNGNMHSHRKNAHPKECLELRLKKYAVNIMAEVSEM